jgi:hypothetical protein
MSGVEGHCSARRIEKKKKKKRKKKKTGKQTKKTKNSVCNDPHPCTTLLGMKEDA